MVNKFQSFRMFLIGGLGVVAISACAPSYKMSSYDTSMSSGNGYSQSAYGYDAVSAYGASFGYEQAAVTTHRSRYGGELRGGCQVGTHPCGMMAVVPVYPVYQYATQPSAPEVQVVEVPQIIEPEPIPYVEPTPYVEPAYEPPVHHWPEPETPVIDWTPLRK